MEKRGFTLVETLMVIVIVGLTMAVAIPRLRSASGKQALHGSRNALMSLYAQTRSTALQQGRSTALRVVGNNVFVTADKTVGYDTIGTVRDFNKEFGVSVTPNGTIVTVSVQGFTSVETVIRTSRDGYTDSIAVSKYGRLLK